MLVQTQEQRSINIILKQEDKLVQVLTGNIQLLQQHAVIMVIPFMLHQGLIWRMQGFHLMNTVRIKPILTSTNSKRILKNRITIIDLCLDGQVSEIKFIIERR